MDLKYQIVVHDWFTKFLRATQFTKHFTQYSISEQQINIFEIKTFNTLHNIRKIKINKSKIL